ncbi:MAG: hypothetical protein RBT50_06405 [Bacteroidales bacterium]|jgi:hypothetical protein|nr:hypothetical protein [Bacteroidales bacterium]
MKKRGVLKWIAMLPVAALVLTGCQREEPDYPSWPELPPSIGAEGGTVVGFDGDVVLTIPPGALIEDLRFRMNELLYKSSPTGCEVLKTFVIEPSVTFREPATLKVYVNGCLANGKTICEEAAISFQIWGNLRDYCSNSGQSCTNCYYENFSNSLTACIDKTGVIVTVGQPL